PADAHFLKHDAEPYARSSSVRSCCRSAPAFSDPVGAGAEAPPQPDTGSANFATSRSVNGAWTSRAKRTGRSERRTSTLAPGGSSSERRPSHQSTPCGVSGATSIASTLVGAVTNGRANSACALIGTISNASTSGQTTGPPAENAYAVEPVGVAHTTPSQPHRDSGRPPTPP